MPKPRLKQLVRESLRNVKSHNRSDDLVKLAREFELFKARLRRMVEALAAEHKCMIMLNKSRLNVAVQISKLAENSPLEACAGKAPNGEMEADSSDMETFMSVHHNMHNRIDMYAGRFSQFILDYAVEWEKVVVTRVTGNLKQSEKLRRELDHYQQKVEVMRLSTNKTMAQGKIVKPEQAERLKRNEEKLFHARRHYEEFASDLCLLIEEVTERSWKDLHPIFIKLAQFDGSIAADEQKYFANLFNVAEDLKQVARSHGLRPQARLKQLETEKGKSVSTRQPGTLLLETRMDGRSHSNSSISFESCNSTDNANKAATTTSSMLHVAAMAPPPPTFEMVEAATRNVSINDNDSANSAYSPIAAPPASAPPPPPPPPKLSMFSQTFPAQDSATPTPKSTTTNPFHPSFTSAPSTASATSSHVPQGGYNPFDSSSSIPESKSQSTKLSTNPFDN